MKKALDFVVIGAQKSGTTSLFEYLRHHPQIHIPPQKEAPFFSRDNRYELGWEWYVQEFFSGAREGTLWGTVTPHYMTDPRVPERMFKMMPGLKLIAVLRSPVYRAFSKYKMAVRWGIENRSFDQAVDELMEEDKVGYARALTGDTLDLTSCYLIWGEYARILDTYRNFFPDKQMLVLFSEELREAPRETLQSILHFLGLSADFTPNNLGKQYHVGGVRRRVDSVYKLKKFGTARRLWRVVPARHRRRFHNQFKRWNVVPETPDSPATLDQETVDKLVDYYRPEVDRLRVILGREVPWPEFQSSGSK